MSPEQPKQPLNLIINQVDNGYTIIETDVYRSGGGAISQRYRGPDSQDLRRQWVAKDADDLANLLKKIASESVALGTQL